jgi:hypothetical protein
VGFASSDHSGEFPAVLCCCCFEFGSFWSSEGWFGFLGLPDFRPVGLVCYIDLTGVGAFCGSSRELVVSPSKDRSDWCCSPV